MRNNKIFKRVAAIMMAGAMMAAMGTSAMADETAATVSAITKKISKGAYDYAPATSFEFAIAPGNAVEAGENQDAIYAGVEGGVSFANGSTTTTITSAPAAGDIGQTEITVGTAAQITVNPDKFTDPGIYRYEITETQGNYEGIDYSDETKYLDVYVTSDGEVSYTIIDSSNPKAKGDGTFVNDYDGKNESLYDLTVTKSVTGNQGDKNKDFTFTVTVDGDAGEKYYVVTPSGTATVTSKDESGVSFTLKDTQSAVIYGLSASDTYTVTENDYSGDGYTTTIGEAPTRTATGKLSTDETMTVVNNREVTTPTGIVMDIAPYLLMVVAALAIAVVFFRKRSFAER